MIPAQEIHVVASAHSASTSAKKVIGHSNSGLPASRPASSHTLNSTFADSAVDMDATTPSESLEQPATSNANYFDSSSPPTSPHLSQTLTEKMRQLTAKASRLEKNETMTPEKRARLENMLRSLETTLADAPSTEESRKIDVPVSEDVAKPLREAGFVGVESRVEIAEPDEEEEEDEWIDESELINVRSALAATLQSMKHRYEEQSHLHQLTIHKLEAVAQRCLAQEQQAEDLVRELRELRGENHTLGHENNELRQQLAYIEAEAAHKDVAVHAMSSAVAGLEGWIESTHASRPQTPVADKKPKRQRVVIRGKGRFRGRYYVDEDGDHAVAYSLADAAGESQELHDGVKAWLRGFRDVEEELRQHESPTRSRQQGRFRIMDHRDEDDWGDFQSPDSYK